LAGVDTASTDTAAATLDVGGEKVVNGGSNVATAKLAEKKEIGRSPGMSNSDDVSGSRKRQWQVVWWLSVGLQLAAVVRRQH
jgi:hypothetical protein